MRMRTCFNSVVVRTYVDKTDEIICLRNLLRWPWNLMETVQITDRKIFFVCGEERKCLLINLLLEEQRLKGTIFYSQRKIHLAS